MLGFFTVSADLTVTQWHEFLENLTGVSSDEVVGKDLLAVFPGLKERGIDFALQHVLEMGAPLKLSRLLHGYFFPSTSNLPTLQNTNIQPIKREEKIIGLLITVEDVSEQALIEADLRRHIGYLEALTVIQQQALHGDGEAVLESIVNYCIKMFNGLYAEIRLLENGEWRLVAAAPATLAKLQSKIRPYQPKIFDHVIYQRTPISLLNLADTSPYMPIDPDAEAVVLAPIQNDDESLGLLVVESDTPAAFLGSGMNQVQAMAASAAAIILDRRERLRSAQRIQALEAQLDVTHLADLTDNPADFMDMGLGLTARSLGALRGAYAVVEPDQNRLKIKALYNFPSSFSELAFPIEGSPFENVLKKQEPLLIRNLSAEKWLPEEFAELLRAYKMHPVATLLAPLITGQGRQGIILLGRDEERLFSPEEIRLCNRFMRVLARAMDRIHEPKTTT